jgi:TRAP-type C4-dicarboxylate transport system substrate-binding protein
MHARSPRHALRLPRRALAAGALALPFLARPAHAAFTWTLFSHQQNPATAIVRGMRRLSDQVRDRTQGALLLTIRTAGTQPIDANQVLEAVGAAKIEMGDDGFHTTSIQPANVLRLPMLATTPAEWDKAAATARPFLDAELQRRGIVLLGHYRSAIQSLWSRTKATSFPDIARQRLRVSSAEQSEFVRNFLGLSLSMSTVEFGETLAAGKADGAFTTAFLGGRAFKQILKHQYQAGPNFLDGIIIANRAAYDELPADLAKALTDSAAEAATWIARTQDAEETQINRQLIAEGLNSTPPKPDDIAEAIQKLAPYWDSWVRRRPGATEDLLAAIRQELDR